MTDLREDDGTVAAHQRGVARQLELLSWCASRQSRNETAVVLAGVAGGYGLLVGGLAAVAVTAKLYWHRILRLFRIRKDEPEPERES